MPLELTRFDVYLAHADLDLAAAVETGAYDVHRVTVLHADQLVAEQAGPRYGLGEYKAAPLAYATLWCWAAMRRAGVEVGEFPLFKARTIEVERIEPDAADQTENGLAVVDPTILPLGTGSP